MRLIHFFTGLGHTPLSHRADGHVGRVARARLGVAVAAAGMTVAACGANARSAPADRAEEHAQEARQEAREARADAERARHHAAEEQMEKQQALDAQHEAELKAAAADQRAADAEMRANRERRGYAPRAGVTERQPERALLFSPGSVELTVEARASLDEMARSIRAHSPGHKVVVEGYTDASGDEGANRDLSQRRADAVASYLIGRGVPRDRLEAKAMGVRNAPDKEDNDAARAQDRRVEVLIQP